MQYTIRHPETLSGTGVHSGRDVSMTLTPAPPGSGISFRRTDIRDGRNPVVPARYDCVADTRLCTQIANEDGVSIGTIEHLMAALAAENITNVMIDIDGPEVPIMDGSSAAFIELIDSAGAKPQNVPRTMFKIIRPVSVEEAGKRASLSPSPGIIYSMEIDFADDIIGCQVFEMNFSARSFRAEVSRARTFGYLDEVSQLRKAGKALGASLENAVAIDRQNGRILNKDGLRYPGNSEFARHKTLDAIGDLALFGGQITGIYEGYKAGHAMNNKLLRMLADNPDCFIEIEVDDRRAVQTGGERAARIPEAAYA